MARKIMSDANLLYAVTMFVLIALLTISIVHPNYLLENGFLSGFINHELVNVLAVTTTVTMAWSGHLLHVLVDIEGDNDWLQFKKLKASLKRNIILLGLYFVLSIFILAVESSIIQNTELRACLYSILLMFLFMNIVSMIQTHMVGFQIPSRKQIKELYDNEFKKS